jgi:hypothetical protein
MLAGLTFAAAGAALLATAGPKTSITLILAGSILLSLHVPLLVATAGYLVAIALAWFSLRERKAGTAS